MKQFIDGDQIVLVCDNFIDLQNSPAIFILMDSWLGKILKRWVKQRKEGQHEIF